jgi:deoxyribodipyrimidine photo-lyase
VPYFRVFNPTTQGQRFDTSGEFIRQFVPELAHLDNKLIHEPKLDLFSDSDYPAPMVNVGETRKAAIAAFKALR